jgi:hypothetical protein
MGFLDAKIHSKAPAYTNFFICFFRYPDPKGKSLHNYGLHYGCEIANQPRRMSTDSSKVESPNSPGVNNPT